MTQATPGFRLIPETCELRALGILPNPTNRDIQIADPRGGTCIIPPGGFAVICKFTPYPLARPAGDGKRSSLGKAKLSTAHSGLTTPHGAPMSLTISGSAEWSAGMDMPTSPPRLIATGKGKGKASGRALATGRKAADQAADVITDQALDTATF